MSSFNTGTNPAPPQHPASAGVGHTTQGVHPSGTTTNSTTTTQTVPTGATTTGGPTPNTVHDGTAGAAAANTLGDKIKGAFNVVHGPLESVRGNFNSFVDDAGEQIAGRGQGDVKPATRTEGGERPANVAARGANEFEAGVERLRR